MIFMDRTFTEREAWVELITDIGVFAYYLYGLMHLGGYINTHSNELASLVLHIVVISVVAAIILSALFGLMAEQNAVEVDERDHLINYKAIRIAHYLIYGGIMFIVGGVLFNISIKGYNEGIMSSSLFSIPHIDILIHGMIITVFVAGIVHKSIQIYLYKRDS